jgi:acyl dehydratase
MRYFEDLEVGEKRRFGKYRVSKEEIVNFAKFYDPQYFHLDEEAAKKSIFKSLCASGWHTAAMTHKMIIEHYFKDIAILGSPGGELFKWTKPVFPDDVLSVETEILDKTLHKKRANVGIIKTFCRTINQNNKDVMLLIVNVLINRRN